MSDAWRLDVPDGLWTQLTSHLFPGDHDEHGAVVAAGVARSDRGNRLLARSVFPAIDGRDYVPGTRGYRALDARFVTDRIRHCRDEELAYIAVHCHGGTDTVALSHHDLASQERGYPALLEIARQPVCGLVLASNAAAGQVWLPNGDRAVLQSVRVVGQNLREYTPAPVRTGSRRELIHDRQARLFGDRGQEILGRLKVGVLGAGGVGSLVVEYLSRLGVGHIVVIDPQRIEPTNLPRVVGSTRRDVWWADRAERWPGWLRRFAGDRATKKVRVAERVARAANPGTLVEPVFGDFVDDASARRFVDCDYLFLAADTMQCRLVFNAVVQQYSVPGFQIGAKVPVDAESGVVLEPYSVVRAVRPGFGCLWCNGFISDAQLAAEALSPEELRRQRYVADPDVPAPSVITMNAVGAAHAVNAMLFAATGLLHEHADPNWRYFEHRAQEVTSNRPRSDVDCSECGKGDASRRARGDALALPTRNR